VRDTLKTTTAAPGRIARNISIATRLSLVVVLVALISLVVTSIVGVQRGSDLAEGIRDDRLNALGAARVDEVERYIAGLERALVAQAISPSTADAITEFSDAYLQLDEEQSSAEDKAAVDQYYIDVVAPELSEARGRRVSAAGLVPRGSAAIRLQAEYVVPDGDLSIATDGRESDWSRANDTFNRTFSEAALRTGVDDFYLIEPEANTIVYSAAKDIDFATSLLFGPQSGSGLAVLINSYLDDEGDAEEVRIQDYTTYPPAGDAPSLFIASPVYAEGVLAGYVAIRIGADTLTSITTGDQSWEQLDGTGETYLVASDNLMRSDARGFIEDESAYLEAVSVAGTATEEQVRSMEYFGTTVLFQEIDYRQVDAALTSEPEIVETTNYLGREVLSSRRAVDVDGLDWALFAEAEIDEVELPVRDFVRNLLVAIALFIVVITFLAARWSDRLLEPLRIISNRLRAIRRGADPDGSAIEIPDSSAKEFVDLSHDIDTMLDTLTARSAAAAAQSAERRDLLNRFLPPPIAQRAEAGERDVVDQVAVATVAVVVISGLGRLMRSGPRDRARELLDRFVEEADELAQHAGLERIRLTGDAYFAACGTGQPHLDHAQRAVTFVLDVDELVGDLAEDADIAIRAGVDSGPVTVGLTGGSSLVYDAWGPTVQRAAELARRAGPGQALVTQAVRAQLSTHFMVEDFDAAGDATEIAIVTGRANEDERIR